jgi:hypothetical protein
MAGSKTDAFEARILDHIFKGGATPALTALSTVYVALYTVVPSDSAGGTEVAGSAYARQAVAAAGWTRTSSSMSNNAEVAFPAVTSTPYTVVGWAIMDAASSGNQLYWGDCTSTVMSVGDIPRFAPSAITVTED